MADDYSKSREKELVLPPGVYAYVLDQTKGPISVYCGPYKSSLSNTDQLVTYNSRTKRFDEANTQQSATQSNVMASKGYYVVLENPAKNGRQPEPGKSEAMPIDALLIGQTENHPGPWSYPLWPGQVATVIKGHQLRSNQYLLVSIVDDEAAKENWDKSVVKSVTGGSSSEDHNFLGIKKDDLTTGQMIIIKGTEISFYIPPTGVEVVKDANDRYVRDAVTLERLEYAVLLDEGGNKEYVRGPAVVFPSPTQEFFLKEDAQGRVQRKFRAYELQPTNGIHIKVIADYVDETGSHVAGDEMFITGKDMPIYYPREEHAIIKYGNQEKTYSVAIPSGEGRYVLNRSTGEIKLVTGPAMFLPNPIQEVVVRRVLSTSECDLYFPGNRRVREVNDMLRNSRESVGGGASVVQDASYAVAAAAPVSRRMTATDNAFADALDRGTTYQPPRTITLDTKFDGAVMINVWSGYAVQIVNSQGDRRTVVGPQSVLLAYDEYLEKLSLSTGTPKSDANCLLTPYLRYISNPVSDVIDLRTHDLVNVRVQVKYLVRFDESRKDNWFSIDNYVQYMVDHLRSLIGNEVRNISVGDFYTDAANILRDCVLGKKPETGSRPLKNFVENGMTVYDLEVISVTVLDRNIDSMLSNSRQETLQDRIELARATHRLEIVSGMEKAKQAEAEAKSTTQLRILELQSQEINQKHQNMKTSVANEGEIVQARKQNEHAAAQVDQVVADIRRLIEEQDLKLGQTIKDQEAQREVGLEHGLAEAQKIRMEAIQGKLVEALTAMAQTGQLEAIAQHLAPLSIVQGESLSGTLNKLLTGTPLEGMLRNVAQLGIR